MQAPCRDEQGNLPVVHCRAILGCAINIAIANVGGRGEIRVDTSPMGEGKLGVAARAFQRRVVKHIGTLAIVGELSFRTNINPACDLMQIPPDRCGKVRNGTSKRRVANQFHFMALQGD